MPQQLTLDHAVSHALTQNPHLLGRGVRIETQQDRVILRGTVRSYFQKQMAQESLRQVAGDARIDNELHVTW